MCNQIFTMKSPHSYLAAQELPQAEAGGYVVFEILQGYTASNSHSAERGPVLGSPILIKQWAAALLLGGSELFWGKNK